MFTRRNSLAVLTSGLMIAVGTTAGCHMIRGSRSSETTRSRWYQINRRAPEVDTFDDEEYLPETEITAPQPSSSSPSSRLSPEPELPPLPEPAPPAELESVPQARWRPAQPRRSSSVSNHSNQNPDNSDLPPARVTYEAADEFAQQPENTSDAANDPRGQPRLFQPAGSAKSMFDSVKRKWSR